MVDMEAAAAGDGEVKPAADSAALPCTTMAAMSVLSLLFVAAVTYVRISPPLVCVYLFLATAAVWRDTATPSLLARVSAFFLLADADSLVGPLAGAAPMLAATAYSAAAVGYAVAERRHHQASEASDAAAAAESPPAYESQAERRHRETCKKFIALIVFFVEAMPAAITYLAWSLQPNENDAPPPQPTGDDEPSPKSVAVCVAATLSGPYLGVWALFVRSILLRGSFVAGDAMCIAAVCVGMSWLVVPVVAGIVLRQINAVLYGHCLYGIAMAGFLGYTLAVNKHYQPPGAHAHHKASTSLGRQLTLPACWSAGKLAMLALLRSTKVPASDSPIRMVASAFHAIAHLNFPAAVWRLSPVICGYLFLMTAAVWRKSATPTRLVGVTASLLLADAADSLVAPLRLPARLAMFAATIYSAAVLGHAVAELRHHAACRRPPSDAAAAADATPVYETKAERGHREHGKEGILVAVVLVNVAVAASLILTSWMVGKEAPAPPAEGGGGGGGMPTSPAADALCMAASVSGPYLAGWTLFVTSTLMRGSFISGDTMWIVMACLGASWLVVPAIAGGALHLFVAFIYGHWLFGIAMAGFLGYTIAVNDHYQELMRIIRSQPRTASDASGLLVGREACDSCSAEINESASVRLSHQHGCFSVSGHCPSCHCSRN
uniref:Uncharacterized protein n=1 Tax=Oryza rufipogon TaxID=4529 RepID=A0A0E0R4X2_ORYRU